MTTADDSADARPGRLRDRVSLVVFAIALLAVAARVVGLGARSFHWDEGRVGYWVLRSIATGAFEYRPVAGGPFLYIVDRNLLAVLGATDFTARLPVAVLGGLLPLVALLYRGRLRDAETTLLAAVLAGSPVLLYYSRFLRGDVPLAVFGLLTVALAYCAVDTGNWLYLYGGAVSFGLALTTSAFVVGYVVCWLVAAALTFDHRRLLGDRTGADERVARAVSAIRSSTRQISAALSLLLLVVLLFYAPRAGDGGPGLWKPTTFPAVVEAAFLGSVRKFVGVRVVGRRHDGTHQLLPYVSDFAGVLVAGAAVVVALALVAFLVDRYGTGESRPLVAFHAYWGFSSVLVFAIVTEVSAPWVAVHTIAPLAVPAAVGAGALVRYGSRAVSRGDAPSVAAVCLVALALTGHVGAVTATNVYAAPSPESPLVHYAQPADDLDSLAANASRAIEGNEGTDVLYYGTEYVARYESDDDYPPVSDEWGNRLPLPWYFERIGAETAGVRDAAGLEKMESLPPVVVTNVSARGQLAPQLDGYEATTYRLALWNRKVVVFVRR